MLLRALGDRVRHGDLSMLVRCGDFTLLRPIGRGGIASVYAAVRDGETSPRFAVKVFDPGTDAEEMLRRFDREHALIRAIEHPAIITVVESGVQHSGQPWFAMPLVDGAPVTREADMHQLRLGDRLRLAELACEGVAAAHSAGIIHRDLKPGNVIAAWRSPDPEVRVIDFGLARAVGGCDQRLTPAGSVHRMGTPDYMAPEQWTDGIASCDARADVFALGMLIAELASGVIARRPSAATPFPATGGMAARTRRHARVAPAAPCVPSEALALRMRDDPEAAEEIARLREMPDAGALLSAVRRTIDPLVAPMIARNPSDRPADASALRPLIAAARRAV